MPYISRKLRRLVRERAKEHCEYCKAPAAILIEMEVDHIRPVEDGGATASGNLCFACSRCNNSKGASQTAIDPETNSTVPLFNPRTHVWQQHFRWIDNFTILVGKTDIGRATLDRLKMNRPEVVKARRLWRKAGWQPPA